MDGFLDVHRQLFTEATNEVHSLTEEISREHNLHLELKYDSQRGYFFRLPISELEDRDLPEEFINRAQRGKKFVEMTTLKLVKCNKKVSSTSPEISPHQEKKSIMVLGRTMILGVVFWSSSWY